MSEYYTVLTNLGAQKVAAAIAGGPALELTDLVVGDGGGGNFYENHDRESLKARSGLVNQRWSGPLYLVDKDPQNPAWAITEGQVPVDVGGWYIREVGIKDSAGDLIAIGVYPETYKPVLAAQIGADLTLRSIIEVGDANTVTLKIDPSVVQATREWVHQHKVDKSQIGIENNQIPTNEDLISGVKRGTGFFSIAKDINNRNFTANSSAVMPLIVLDTGSQALMIKIQGYRENLTSIGSVDLMLAGNSQGQGVIATYYSEMAASDPAIAPCGYPVIFDYEGVRYAGLRLDATSTRHWTGAALITGYVRLSQQTRDDANIYTLLGIGAVQNLTVVENTRQQHRGRPGDQIGSNTAWHSGNTIIDADGFIKGA